VAGNDNGSKLTRSAYPFNFQILPNARGIRTALGIIDDVNPTGGILDGEGLVFRENRGNNPLNPDRVSALRLLAPYTILRSI
jgi:hypothetical protein